MFDIEIPDYTHTRQEILNLILEKQEHFYEAIHKTKEGKEIHVEINSKLIDYKGPNITI